MTDEKYLTMICNSAAQHRQPDFPEGLDLNDLKLHTCLDRLYENYERGILPLESCKALKDKLIACWRSDKQTAEQYEKFVSEWNSKIMTANKTGIELHKAESLRDFAKGAAIIIEALTGDVGLTKLAETLPEVNF